jgi:hypothetical protein
MAGLVLAAPISVFSLRASAEMSLGRRSLTSLILDDVPAGSGLSLVAVLQLGTG